MHMHDHVAGDNVLDVLAPTIALLVCAGVYLHLARRARRRNPAKGWSPWRTTSFSTGLALLAVALLPPIAPFAHTDFRGHMAQHMLIGMYAPLALVLGAPVTLLLRAVPAAHGRQISAILHSRPARLLALPLPKTSSALVGVGVRAVGDLDPVECARLSHGW